MFIFSNLMKKSCVFSRYFQGLYFKLYLYTLAYISQFWKKLIYYLHGIR